MKALLLSVCFLTAAFITARSQSSQSEFAISYGIFSTNGEKITQSALEGLFTVFTLGLMKYEYKDLREAGPVFLTWKNIRRQRLGIGVSAGFMNVSYTAVVSSIFSNQTSSYKVNYNALTLLPEIDYRYITTEKMQLYSGLGIGYTFIHHREDRTSEDVDYRKNAVDIHLTALGIRYGKEVKVFAELGIGCKGFLQFGLSFNINSKKNQVL